MAILASRDGPDKSFTVLLDSKDQVEAADGYFKIDGQGWVWQPWEERARYCNITGSDKGD